MMALAGALAMAPAIWAPAAWAQTPVQAQALAPSGPLPPNDYSDKANWLCWPGSAGDACRQDQSATVVKADGSTQIEAFTADPHAPIDCFYVYPTVSLDPGVLSSMTVQKAETRVVEQQFARFGGKCRLYAPMPDVPAIHSVGPGGGHGGTSPARLHPPAHHPL
jgi:hypothetical protein